ncbi:DUF5803 family protein [Halorarius litoreus]|uniref:DUF5803 family protein n=1 Tax=Halorarius litoreus TaxID=2962676 RepID=UPI0020CDA3AD|nr:DUF5803 family protein [Halorarius litoreus]
MRKYLALFGLVLLTASAGCSSFLGPGPVDAGAVSKDATYDWAEPGSAYIEINRNNYTATYAVANRTTGDFEDDDPTIELYTRDALGTEQPLDLAAVQFHYPNGTTVAFRERDGRAVSVIAYPNGTTEETPQAMFINKTRRRTVVHLPANETGELGVTIAKNGKQISSPTFVEGDYEMVLPADTDISIPLLAQVRPARSGAETIDNRVHVYWEDVTAPSIAVRYYLERDLFIFSALVGGLSLMGLVGAIYYLRQIRETRRRREEVGLDMDIEDDDRKGPPPGMR